MKKTTMKGLLMAILFFACSMGSGHFCYGQTELLKSSIKEMKAMMPMSMGMVGNLTDIAITGKILVITATVDETLIDITALQNEPELVRANMQQMILNNDSGIQSLMEELKKSDMGIKLVYVGGTSGKTVSCTLSSEEVKHAGSGSDPQKTLELQISLVNAQLPIDFGNGMVNTQVVREGNYVVYYFVCDEDIFDIDVMNKNIPLMRELILSEVNGDDLAMSMFRKMCKEAGCGMAYYYVGEKSGKIAKALVPVEDLK